MARRRQYRNERLSKQIQKELSEIILYELSDPRASFVTVSRVDLSKDLAYATAFVSTLGGEREKKACMGLLGHARGFIQRELGNRLTIHATPELRFEWDPSIAKAIEVKQILDEIAAERGDEDEDEADEVDTDAEVETVHESSDADSGGR